MSDDVSPSFSAPRRPEAAAADFDAAPKNLLEQVLADLAIEVAEPDVRVPVKTREGYELQFSSKLPYMKLSAWQGRCKDKKIANQLDALKLACLILYNLSTGILLNGTELDDPDRPGEPMTLRSGFIADALGVSAPQEVIIKFFVRDSLIEATATAILSACGYDDEVAADPTSAS